MAHQYSYSAGNPEGTEFTIFIEHDIKMSQEIFNQMIEETLVEWAEDKKSKGQSIFWFNSNECFPFLEEKGFRVSSQKCMSYYLEPYWGVDSIKSEKLRELVDEK